MSPTSLVQTKPSLLNILGAPAVQDKDMVRLLLEMKIGLDTVLNEAFQRSETFGHAMKDAFEHFINQRANRQAGLLAGQLAVQRKSGGLGP